MCPLPDVFAWGCLGCFVTHSAVGGALTKPPLSCVELAVPPPHLLFLSSYFLALSSSKR